MAAKKKVTRKKHGGGANMVPSQPYYYAHIGGGGARAKKMTRLDELREMLPKSWQVHTYSPGDGVTRYRFFHNAPAKQTYFGPANGAYTALGMKEAVAFAAGLGH